MSQKNFSARWRAHLYPHPPTLARATKKNHSTQDSRVVPHRGTNWAALWLTSQIGRDAVLSESYGRGWMIQWLQEFMRTPETTKNAI